MEKLRPAWAVKAIIVIVFTSILFRCVCGENHTVGGASGWELHVNIQAWASTTTFNIGDNLVFTYTPSHDVVEVNQRGYDTCAIVNALATYNDGETVIHLSQAGTRYFVCGRQGHCQQGLKLQAQVLAQTNNGTAGSPPPPPSSPPPSPPSPLPLSPPDSPPPPPLPLSPPASPPPPHDNEQPPADEPVQSDCSGVEGRLEVVPWITIVIVVVLPFI